MTKQIDEMDRRILRALKADGRITNLKLAESVNLSASACLRRVQDLEAAGVIKGYRARVDPCRDGRSFVAYVTVGLSSHTKAAQEGFERAMAIAHDVVECHNVAGAFEYLLRVETEDLASYKRFHTDTLGTLTHVASITSYIVMGSSKDERG
ncbi:Lrp/AsnC family transcriptional regulator [Fulvimarina sp. 2208YS6-2-32]|uniref:Lrp/AsnC family transcriptional regulator n=1 Tax=Fulvimarina uroteuthidis TaxID=3098149 RepID=A0ABU5I6K2_9HYPH|nr:Lrp/AsnC family transcriptional regulator [Fulvimarina sp. 2208YS6-2-32]MDY8111015.1 Lrp/AsnC family transcriptional regulator [Fulvimarina sp. 2208YS6-2-32]